MANSTSDRGLRSTQKIAARIGEGSITDVGSISVGHYHRNSRGWLTGTTVLLFGAGAVAGVDVRGGGPGTRETDLLRPENLIQKIHAVVLSGGSAYGLASAHGVMEYLESRKTGFSVGTADDWVVPIVPGAVIFDLGRGGDFKNRPDANFGWQAARRAKNLASLMGNVGAGMGARSGGLRGGLGMASTELADGVVVSALAVVNSVGSAIDPDTALPWDVSATRLNSPSSIDRRRLIRHLHAVQPKSLNTTIGVVATNFPLTKTECSKFASVAHDGLARAVRPAHLMNDGDTIFGISVGASDRYVPDEDPTFGDPSGRPAVLNRILGAGANVFSRACTEAILNAETTRGLPSYRQICPSAFRGMP